MTLTKPLETIAYSVYRGKLEPITEQTTAEVNLYKDHLELVYNYKFEKYPSKEETHRLVALTASKPNISIGITTRYLEEDPNKECSPVVEVYVNGCYIEDICVKGEKEAYEIYKKLRTWLIQ
jgi:hypothetical protein